MAAVTPQAARRSRAYVRVQGPDAVDYLNRMLSNDVPDSGSVDALLTSAFYPLSSAGNPRVG